MNKARDYKQEYRNHVLRQRQKTHQALQSIIASDTIASLVENGNALLRVEDLNQMVDKITSEYR